MRHDWSGEIGEDGEDAIADHGVEGLVADGDGDRGGSKADGCSGERGLRDRECSWGWCSCRWRRRRR